MVLGWSLLTSTSNKFPGGAEAVGLGPHVGITGLENCHVRVLEEILHSLHVPASAASATQFHEWILF